jgi:hypothetical protein
MSIIIEPVKDLIDDAFDIIEDVGESIIDGVEWIADEIVEPVFDATVDVVQAALDDPIKTIAQVAAVATGNAWALPLIAGADVALAGGDFGDIATAMAVSYVAGEAGEFVGEYAGEYVGDALAGTDLGNYLNEVAVALEYGTDIGSAQTAQIVAQDVGINALSTAIGDMVGASLGSATTATILGGDPLSAATMAAINSSTKYVMDKVGNTNTTYSNLGQPTQDVIKSSVSTVLSGGDLTNVALDAATNYASSLTNAVSNMATDFGLNEQQKAIAASVLSNAYATAFKGGDVSAAIDTTFAQIGTQELGDKIKEFGTKTYEDIKTAYDKATTAADEFNTTKDELAIVQGDYQDFIDRVNGEVAKGQEYTETAQKAGETYTTKYNEVVKLQEAANKAIDKFNADRTSQANYDAANAAIDKFNKANDALPTYMEAYEKAAKTANDYNSALQGKFDEGGDYTKTISAYETNINKLLDTAADQKEIYENYNTLFENSFDILNTFTQESTKVAQQSIVDVMTEDGFDAEYYADKVGVTKDEAVQHYLEVGQYADVPVNAEIETSAYLQDLDLFVNQAAQAAGVNLTTLPPEAVKEIVNNIGQNYDSSLALQNAMKAGDYGNVTTAIQQLAPDTSDYAGLVKNASVGLSDGVTYTDIVKDPNNYYVGVSEDGESLVYKPLDAHSYKSYNAETGTNGVTGVFDSDGNGTLVWGFEDTNPDTGELTILVTGTKDGDLPIYAAGIGSVDASLIYDFIGNAIREQNPLNEIANAVDYIWEDLGVGEKASELVNSALDWAEETGQDPETSDWLRDTLGVVIAGGGELFDAYVTAFDVLSDEGASDGAKALAERMVKLGGDIHSDQYKENLAELNEIMGQGVDPDAPWYEQVAQQASNVFEAIGEHPTTFLAEFVATELVQELPTVLTFGAGKVLTVGAKSVGYADDVAKWLGRTGTLAAETVAESAEAFGATYGGAYDQIKNEALNMGYSLEEANQLAEDGAIQSAWIATGAALAAQGVGGLEIEKLILDKKIPSKTYASIWDNLGKDAKQIISASGKESIAEALEEGFVEYTTGTYIQDKVNPDYNIIEGTTTSALLGGIAGGTVSGTVGTIFGGAQYLGEASDVSFTDNILKQYSTTYAADIDAAVATGNVADVTKVLKDYGITDTATQVAVTNKYYDATTQTLGEVQATAAADFDYFDFSGTDLNAYTGTGKTDANTVSSLETYVDPLYTDVNEVKAEALKQGQVLTDEQAQQYVGQTKETTTLKTVNSDADKAVTTQDEAADMFAALGYNVTKEELAAYPTLQQLQSGANAQSEADIKQYIDAYAADRMFTYDEAKQALLDAGYVNPTDEQINQFVGQANDAMFQANQEKALGEWYDKATTTEAEAKQYFADLGYVPSEQELAQFVGQGDDTFDSTNKTNLGVYVDPRQTTEQEAAAMFEAANGYKPTAEELAQFTGQGGQNFQTETGTAVSQYVDPRQVTYEEAQQLFADANGYVPTEAELEQFIGQGGENFQTTTGTQLGEYVDPRQVTYDEAVEMFKAYTGFDYTPTPEELQAFVGQGGADFTTGQQTGIDQYIDDNSVTGEEVVEYVKSLGYQLPDNVNLDYLGGQFAENTLPDVITDNQGAMTYNLLSATMEGYAAQGAAADEALQKSIDDVAADLGTTKEELLTALGETEQSLLDKMAAGNEALATQIGEVETALSADIADVATALGTTEENLTAAIGDVATQLGTTEQNLLDAMATGDQNVIDTVNNTIANTEAALSADIQTVADTLGIPPQTVTQNDIDLVSNWLSGTQPETWSDYQLGYDVDGDGQITQADLELIQGKDIAALAEAAPDSRYGNMQTMFGYNEQIAADQAYQNQMLQEQQQQMEENIQQQMQENLNTQMQQNQQLATQTQQMSNIGDLYQMLMGAEDISGQQVSVRASDPARINYMYDFSSIFANPQQAGLFASPYGVYAEGGKVESDDDDELYRLLGAQ